MGGEYVKEGVGKSASEGNYIGLYINLNHRGASIRNAAVVPNVLILSYEQNLVHNKKNSMKIILFFVLNQRMSEP